MLVTVALKPRSPDTLESYATDVSTPGSNVYRQFLSVAQFRARFAPTDAQIAAVSDSLRTHGLSPSPVTANGLAISVTAPAAAIERAFSTSLNRLSLANGRTAFANTVAPLLDPSIAGLVQDVVGLDNLSVPQPVGLVKGHAKPRVSRHVPTGGPQPCATASSVASSFGSYTTDQIASAYRFSGLYGAGDEGAGQTVAIYELEGNIQSDVTAYESCYGISAPVSYSEVDGGPPPPDTSASDGLETSLDIDNVVGLAPRVNVLVYQGPNSNSNLPGAGPYDVYNAIISQNRAHVISTSWGICESQDTPVPTAQQDENTLFQEAATQGQSVFAAAGDSGSEDCTDSNGIPEGGLAAGDPASQPFVTGAGGTTMPALGPPPTEAVWNDPESSGVCAITLLGLPFPVACGGGGGVSSLWGMPSYQSGAPASLNVINSNSSGATCGAPAGTNCREVPDVSADADPATGYTAYYNGDGTATDSAAWTPIGGTSGAAPLWAALAADANASPFCGGSPIGFANPALYRAAAAAYGLDFNDVRTGNNDATMTNGGLYPAGPGYDMATGLGTPSATNLAGALCIVSVHVRNPGNQSAVLRVPTRLAITATDSPGKTLTYSARGLPSGLSINAATGTISGTPSAAGVYGVTVYATDNDSAIGSTAFAWAVVATGPPKLSRGALTGIHKRKPKLSFTLNAGTRAGGIAKVVLTLPKGLRLSGKKRNLSKGISLVAGSGKVRSFKLKLSGGRLTITLSKAVRQLRVTLKTPALTASNALVNKVKRHKSGKLNVTVTVTDANGHATRLATKLKPF